MLVHCEDGRSKSVVIVSAWMMKKFKWSLLKSLEFLNFRRPGIDLPHSFISQLAGLETRLDKSRFPSTNWQEVKDNSDDSEEMILRNTYLNAQVSQFADYNNVENKLINPKLKWRDDSENKTDIVEIVGIAASSKENSNFIMTGIRPINRGPDPFNAKGP